MNEAIERALDRAEGRDKDYIATLRRHLLARESEARIARDAFKDSEARCNEWIKTAESYRQQVIELERQVDQLTRRAVQ